MKRIVEHPILDIPEAEEIIFKFNGQDVVGYKGYTIAAALHQAGFRFTVTALTAENAVSNAA